MANRRRGEVPLTLGTESYTLCLTLGALAELETALEADSLTGLAERFSTGRLATRDCLVLFGAALRGGGHDLDDAAIARLPIAGDFPAIADALGAVLAAAFGEAESPPAP